MGSLVVSIAIIVCCQGTCDASFEPPSCLFPLLFIFSLSLLLSLWLRTNTRFLCEYILTSTVLILKHGFLQSRKEEGCCSRYVTFYLGYPFILIIYYLLVALWFLNIIVLALAAKINVFQEFFCSFSTIMSTRRGNGSLSGSCNAQSSPISFHLRSPSSPLLFWALCSFCLFSVFLLFNLNICRISLDFATSSSYLGHPQIEIPIFAIFSIFWLGMNRSLRSHYLGLINFL